MGISELVRLKGLEPPRVAAREPKSRMSTNSITGAQKTVINYTTPPPLPSSPFFALALFPVPL